MRLELQWAFTEKDIPDQPCDLCEIHFRGKAVVIRTDPYGYEACEECLRALSRRKDQAPGAPWPTWEDYQEAVREHPEPMFANQEEMDASEPDEDPYQTNYDASWLWQAARG